MMDALERVRQEERAKLEALQAREREKTRQMVEKERAKLEAELEKEIKALEAQLAKEMAKAEITDPVPSLSLREEKPEVPKRTRKKAAAKPATKVPAEKEVVQTAVAIDLGDQPVPEAAASGQKFRPKLLRVPVPAESMEAAQESGLFRNRIRRCRERGRGTRSGGSSCGSYRNRCRGPARGRRCRERGSEA